MKRMKEESEKTTARMATKVVKVLCAVGVLAVGVALTFAAIRNVDAVSAEAEDESQEVLTSETSDAWHDENGNVCYALIPGDEGWEEMMANTKTGSGNYEARFESIDIPVSILEPLSTEELLRLAIINPLAEMEIGISSDSTGAEGVARMVNRSNVYEVLMNRDDVIETIYAVQEELYEDVKDYLHDMTYERTGVDLEMSSIESTYKWELTTYINYIEQNKTLTEEQEDMIKELRLMLM